MIGQVLGAGRRRCGQSAVSAIRRHDACSGFAQRTRAVSTGPLRTNTSSGRSWTALAPAVAGIVLLGCAAHPSCDDHLAHVQFTEGETITNWSATHSCHPARIYEPQSLEELCQLVQTAHQKHTSLRPIGTALSPNGIGMTDGNAVSLTYLDRVLRVDKEKMEVTVQAGARVSQVLQELSKHGMTLENFSSIQEQQIGGWTQVAAHGTGGRLPTVEEQIVAMKVVTPSEGLISLSKAENPELFPWFKCNLGTLGVVAEVTLKCVPAHWLQEHTFCTTWQGMNKIHADLLRSYQHVRYMWIPYTDTVVVVVSNPIRAQLTEPRARRLASTNPTEPLVKVVRRFYPDADLDSLSFAQLRDMLLDVDPLNSSHVRAVNEAEARFWQNMAGSRAADSVNVLGFDCGGQQWVLEVCFPTGTLRQPSDADLQFVAELQQAIRENNIPAPAPIEQRWTARSSSPMSPAFSTDPNAIFTWVGIIMYMPPGQSEEQRMEITRAFERYCQKLQPLLDKYNARVHWAKIEPHVLGMSYTQAKLEEQYDLSKLRALQQRFDPHLVLSNSKTAAMLGLTAH